MPNLFNRARGRNDGSAQPVTYLVVQGVRVGRGRSFSDPEDLAQFTVEPVPHGGSPEHSPIRAQPSPRVPSPVLRHWTLTNTQLVQRQPAGVQQPGYVMVRLHKQTGRVRKRLVLAQQSCINVAMRGDDRPFPDLFVQPPCDRAHLGIGGEEPVRMQCQWCEVTRHGTHAGRLVSYEQSVAVCRRPSGPNSNTQNGNGSVTDGRQHSAGPVRIARGGRVVVLERSGRTQATPPMASIACRRACSA